GYRLAGAVGRISNPSLANASGWSRCLLANASGWCAECERVGDEGEGGRTKTQHVVLLRLESAHIVQKAVRDGEVGALKVGRRRLVETILQEQLTQKKPVFGGGLVGWQARQQGGVARPLRAQAVEQHQVVQANVIQSQVDRLPHVALHLFERLSWQVEQQVRR